MGKIYLVRHGETVLNIEKRYQGYGDSPLTERGISQAQALGEKMKDVKIDKAYSSDLGRVIATTRYILGDRDMEINQLKGLREFYWGDWEGLTYQEIGEKYNFPTGPERSKYTLNTPKNGDVAKTFADRISTTIDQIAKENADKDILVVSSNMAIVFMLNYIEGRDIWNCDLKQGRYLIQTSLTTIQNDHGKLTIIDEGNTDHLKEIGFDGRK